MIKNVILLLVVTIVFTGCRRFDRTYVPASEKVLGLIHKDQFMPRAYRQQYFDHAPHPKYDAETMYNNTDQSYERGFQDGCQSATSAIGDGLARFHGPKFDAEELGHNPWYLRGYQDAAEYCTMSLDWETH